MPEPFSGRAAFAEALFRTGALRFGKFTLPGGKTSSYHLDLRVVPSDPEAYGLAVAACTVMIESAGKDSFDALAGLGIAGTSLASPLAHILRKPLLCLRSGEGGRALDWTVEGAPRPRWRALLVTDEVGTGRSIASAAGALGRAGCVVKEAIAIVDRQEGGKATLGAVGVTLSSFTDMKDLAVSLFESKAITKANYEMALKEIAKSD